MLKKQWFSIAIIICLVIAYLLSKNGFNLNQSSSTWIKYFCVIAIFVLSGLTIETLKLFDSIKQWQAHLLIQSVSFIGFPLIVIGTAVLMGLSSGSDPLYIGFVVLACIPTTISSCVVFTKNAGGNVECALFNATLGNILGIFLTPLLIFLLLKENVQIDVLKAMKKLVTLVLIPFFFGQLLHNQFSIKVNATFSKITSNILMLCIMFVAFLNAFQKGVNLDIYSIFMILVLSLVLHLFVLGFVWQMSSKLFTRFTLADRKCITITASQKTVALGLPITAILFAQDPNLALISLPVIIYHTIQLFIDGIIVGSMAQLK